MRGVAETATWTTGKIRASWRLIDQTVDYVRRALPKIYSRELVDLLFEQPYCRISNVVDAGIVERQTASRYLKELVAIGVLDEVAAGRERLFINRRFFDLLTHDSNSTAPFG
jgi:Fic family protein